MYPIARRGCMSDAPAWSVSASVWCTSSAIQRSIGSVRAIINEWIESLQHTTTRRSGCFADV